jgi:hypothetical protein
MSAGQLPPAVTDRATRILHDAMCKNQKVNVTSVAIRLTE